MVLDNIATTREIQSGVDPRSGQRSPQGKKQQTTGSEEERENDLLGNKRVELLVSDLEVTLEDGRLVSFFFLFYGKVDTQGGQSESKE